MTVQIKEVALESPKFLYYKNENKFKVIRGSVILYPLN